MPAGAEHGRHISIAHALLHATIELIILAVLAFIVIGRTAVGVLAASQPSAEPPPAPPPASAPAAAPWPGPRDSVRALAAVGEARLLAGEQAHQAVAVGVAPVLASGRALAVPRLGALLHPDPVPVQEHLAVIGPPRSWKSALAVLADHVLARSGRLDLVQAGHLPADLRRAAEVRSGLGVQPAGHRRHRLERAMVAARRLRPPGSTARRRAEAFAQAVSMAGAEDGGFFAGKAADSIAGMFTAAATTGRDMRARQRLGRNTAGRPRPSTSSPNAAIPSSPPSSPN